jgi:HlyD family secretion protein
MMTTRPTLAAATALLIAGCFSGYSETPARGELHLRRGAFHDDVVLTGALEAARGEEITVPALPSSQTSIKWIANDGVEVAAGERVVELDNTAFTADLDSKRQAALQATQELQQKAAEWSADLQQKALDVEKKKSEMEKAKIDAAVPAEIVSSRDYEDRQMKLSRATVEYAKAKAVLASQRKADDADRANQLLAIARAQRDVDTAQHAIEALVLSAPRAGIVVLRETFDGRKFQSGDNVWISMPLAQIPDLDTLQVSASLADVDDGLLAAGMPATVTLDGYPARPFPGRVASVSAVAQESARASLRRAFRVVVKMGAIDAAVMRPGLSARVAVRRETKADALLVPRAALDFGAAQPRAHLAGGKVVPVTLGSCNAQECVVVSGLDADARLEPALKEESGRG